LIVPPISQLPLLKGHARQLFTLIHLYYIDN
jgi:hypothetical protein